MPVQAFLFPGFIELQLRSRRYKKLHFHLLELTHTENKLPRNDLVTEGFSYLRNPERQAVARGFLHVQEIHENSLRCFGTQI